MRRGRDRVMGSSAAGDPVVTVLLVALWTICVLGTVAVVQRAFDTRDDLDQRAADAVGVDVARALQESVSSFIGADSMAADGRVTEAEFMAFASDVLSNSLYSGLGFSEPVAADGRTAWEIATGITVRSFATDDGAARDGSVVLHYVLPESASSALGLDLLSDPARRHAVEEAIDSTGPVIAGPISLATSSAPGLFTIKAIRGADDDVLGFVSSGVDVDALVEAVPAKWQERLAIEMDGVTLIDRSVARGGATASFSASGRAFTLYVDDPGGADATLPSLGLIATMLVGAAAVLSWRRDRRARRAEATASRRSQAIAALAGRLADATTSVELMRTIADHAGEIVGAERTRAGRLDLQAPHRLIVDEGATTVTVPTDAHEPITEATVTATAVVVADRAAGAQRFPHTADAMQHDGIESVICVPLMTSTGTPAGALGYAWAMPLDQRSEAELLAVTRSVADVAARALERTLLRELVQLGAEQIGDIARRLSAARTPDAVAAIVDDGTAARLLDVARVQLEPGGARGDDESLAFPLTSTEGAGAQLVVTLQPGQIRSSVLDAVVHALVELVDGAWGRARQHQHEHGVVERLQQALFVAPPELAHLDVAVRYQAAMDTIGIGGDWYSVIDRDDATYLVIGDVAGHGPAAVAIMSEVKTLLRHLLSLGTPIDEAFHHVDRALLRRNALATAVAVRTDKRSFEAQVVNAGHPYPILRQDGAAHPIEVTHRPLLGLPVEQTPPATTIRFEPGDLLLLYTDGLIERRGQPIDVSIRDLADRIDDRSPHEIADTLADRPIVGKVDVVDDIALIAALRLGSM